MERSILTTIEDKAAIVNPNFTPKFFGLYIFLDGILYPLCNFVTYAAFIALKRIPDC